MEEMMDGIYSHLRRGAVKDALDDLYEMCKMYAPSNLDEVVSHLTKIQLIGTGDRSGTITFEERIRLEAQISSSVLKLTQSFENRNNSDNGQKIIQKLQANLDVEREKRINAESKLIEFEKLRSEKASNKTIKEILVRDYVVDEKIELKIIALTESATSKSNYAVVLGEEIGKRRLPIVIGSFEAQAIAVALEKMVPNRPLTHDLMKTTIELLGYVLKEIVIDALEGGIFYSKIVLFDGERNIEVDSRTADAIALAVRFEAPIYTHNFILKAAGVVLDE
jgi:bifunctional DNase/RNase